MELDDILMTEELCGRSPRPPDFYGENQAMRSLAWQLAHEPDQMLQRLVELARELCDSDTAGVSLIETQANGEEVFRWGALAGALTDQAGSYVSRQVSPCGVCLERGIPVLFAYPERYFTVLQQANLPMPEMLVLPLVVANQPLGTLWLVAHHEQRQFDPEDVRLMTGMADFAVATLQRHQQQGRALVQESTERQRAEEQALALIENLPGGAVFVVDRDLRYTMAAGEALEATNFQAEDFVGRTIFEVLSPELAASYEPTYRMALAGESFEHEHQTHGRCYISRGTPLRAKDGEIYGALAVSYDITERKQAEAAIAADLRNTCLLHDLTMQVSSGDQEQDLFQRILDTAVALMHADMGSLQILDSERNELYLQSWRGFHPDAAVGWQIVGLDDGSSCGAALKAGERVIVSDTETCDFMANTADLEFYRLCGTRAVQSTPLLDHAGQFVGMISTHWRQPHHPDERELRFLDLLARQAADLIEQRQAEAALQQMMQNMQALNKTLEQRVQQRTAQLEAINQELDAFSLMVSHDLQTPLRYISGFAERLQAKLNAEQLDPSSRRYLRIIEQAADQAQQMINDLLEFSRMGKMPLRLTRVSMDQLVGRVRSQLTLETTDRPIEWHIEPLPEVQGDPQMLRLVMQNLLSNAVKYTRHRTPARITIGSNVRGQEIVFFVQDNGAGFDMKYQDRLFSLFQRLHTQEQFAGTGVGLANVRRIIHRHGGRVWAQGGVDQGATFYFSLPQQEALT